MCPSCPEPPTGSVSQGLVSLTLQWCMPKGERQKGREPWNAAAPVFPQHEDTESLKPAPSQCQGHCTSLWAKAETSFSQVAPRMAAASCVLHPVPGCTSPTHPHGLGKNSPRGCPHGPLARAASTQAATARRRRAERQVTVGTPAAHDSQPSCGRTARPLLSPQQRHGDASSLRAGSARPDLTSGPPSSLRASTVLPGSHSKRHAVCHWARWGRAVSRTAEPCKYAQCHPSLQLHVENSHFSLKSAFFLCVRVQSLLFVSELISAYFQHSSIQFLTNTHRSVHVNSVQGPQ